MTLIIGHRGASALAPENTLAAFERAMLDQADGIEFDVQLSRDEVPVVIHDARLVRTANLAREVSDLTLEELQQLEVGSWFNRKFPRRARAAFKEERLPTLQDVFDFYASRKGQLYLEMKCAGSACEALISKCLELIHENSFAKRTVVECFDLSALSRLKKLDSGVRTAALFEPRLKQPASLLKRMAMLNLALDSGADEVALHHTLITRRIVDRARQLSLPCVVWTVDHPRWVQRAKDLGLKALITNNPAKMKSKT